MSLPVHPIEAATRVSISLRDWLVLIGTIVVLVSGATYQLYAFQEENRIEREKLYDKFIRVVEVAVKEDAPFNEAKEGIAIRFNYSEQQIQKNSEQIAVIATTVTQLATTVAEQQKTNVRIADSLDKIKPSDVYRKVEDLEKKLSLLQLNLKTK